MPNDDTPLPGLAELPELPDLRSLPDGHEDAVLIGLPTTDGGIFLVTPNVDLPLYSLYEGEKPLMPSGFIMDLIIVHDWAEGTTPQEMAKYFNLDADEVELFFRRSDWSDPKSNTATQWLGELELDPDEDGEAYEAVVRAVMSKWVAAQEMEISYVLWSAEVVRRMEKARKEKDPEYIHCDSLEQMYEQLDVHDAYMAAVTDWEARRHPASDA